MVSSSPWDIAFSHVSKGEDLDDHCEDDDDDDDDDNEELKTMITMTILFIDAEL